MHTCVQRNKQSMFKAAISVIKTENNLMVHQLNNGKLLKAVKISEIEIHISTHEINLTKLILRRKKAA